MKLPTAADADTDSSSADNAGSQQDVDFSDYMWMGEEMEEFDSKVSLFYFIIHLNCLLSYAEYLQINLEENHVVQQGLSLTSQICVHFEHVCCARRSNFGTN